MAKSRWSYCCILVGVYVMVILFSLVAHASVASVSLSGSVYSGLVEETLRKGGSTLILRTVFPMFEKYTKTELKTFLREMLSVSYAMNENGTRREMYGVSNYWQRQLPQLVEQSRVDVLHEGRAVRLTFHPFPEYVVEETVLVVPCLPLNDIQSPATGSGRERSKHCQPGNPVLITPKILVGINSDKFSKIIPPQYIAGNLIEIPFMKDNGVELGSRIKVMEGNACFNTRSAIVSASVWDDGEDIYRFVTHRGGLITLCYMPFPEALPNVMLKVGDSLNIAGAETILTEPPQIRPGEEFIGYVYGTNLSEQDVLIITQELCNEFTPDSIIVPEVSLSSNTRAIFFTVLNKEGIYHVCYRCEGSAMYIKATTLLVEKEDVNMIETNSEKYFLDKSTDLYSSSGSNLDCLHVKRSRSLFLKHESINISSFIWTGGHIGGEGDINSMGVSTITSQSHEPRTISFLLRNYGDMVIDVPQLNLVGDGAIHNYGSLTIIVTFMKFEGFCSIASRSRNNAIINRGGIIRIATVDNEHSVLCRARIMNTEGKLIISGNLKITDIIIGEKAHLVLHNKTRVFVLDAMVKGRVTLLESSQLTLSGDCAFVSALVEGNHSHILLTGESVLFDSLTISGSVTASIIGRSTQGSPVVVAMYGINCFGKETRLHLWRTHLITNTGLSELLIEGIMTAEIDSVIFSGNISIQNANLIIIYGKGRTNFISEKEGNSLVSFAVREDATLVVLDVEPSNNSHVKCDTTLLFLEHLTLDGHLLLRGCMIIPLGGTIGGTVEMLRPYENADKFLMHLPNPRVALLLHTSPWPRASLLLGGEVQLQNESYILVDEIIMKNAILTGDSTAYLGAETRVLVDYGSRLVLQRQWVLNTSVIYVEGQLEADMAPGPVIHGSLNFAVGGRLNLHSVQMSPCFSALNIEGNVEWEGEPHIDCASLPLLAAPDVNNKIWERNMTHKVRRMLFSFFSDLECPEEYLRQEFERMFFFHYFLESAPYDPPPNIPTVRNMIIWGTEFIVLGVMILFVFLWFRGLTWKEFYLDLGREPPLRLILTGSEFALHTWNYMILAVLLFTPLQTILSSFHLRLPVPVGYTSTLRFRSVYLIMPHHRSGADAIMRITMICTLLWGCIAFLLIIVNRKMTYIKARGLWYHKVIKLLFKFDNIIHFFFLVFTVPTRSLILDYLACNTFLSELPTCTEARGTVLMPLCSLFLLTVLMPWRRHSPLSLLKCDMLFKESVFVALYAISVTEVALWKVFYQSPVLLLINNMIFQMLQIMVYYKGTPTAYRNINRFLLQLSFVPSFVHFGTLFHVIRVRLKYVKTCYDGEAYFKVMFLLCFLWVVVILWDNIVAVKLEATTTNDAAIDAIQRSLVQIRSRVQELGYEFLTCASTEERENVLNATARLRVELMEKHKRYRYEKYCYLLDFLFAGVLEESDTKGVQRQKHRFASRYDDLNVKTLLALRSSSGTPVGSPSASTDSYGGDGEPLTQEEMESFRCGPALGSGSYGTVHLGILPSGRLVAVKYVNRQNTSKEDIDQVMKEVNTLKELSHPNIIRYYGCCADEECVLLFMEFAVAGSLSSIVRNLTGLNESVIAFYTYQVLRGLCYLHEKGVVHRDIKGENILVDGSGVVKLADFGSCKLLAGLPGRSRAGCETLVGSPFWMAPEVIRNEPYGTKADIWSVGCTVVEMLNGGTPPWREKFDNVYSLMYYVGSTDNIPSIPEDTSEVCRDFLKMCFQRDTARRPLADELLQHPWLSDVAEDA